MFLYCACTGTGVAIANGRESPSQCRTAAVQHDPAIAGVSSDGASSREAALEELVGQLRCVITLGQFLNIGIAQSGIGV